MIKVLTHEVFLCRHVKGVVQQSPARPESTNQHLQSHRGAQEQESGRRAVFLEGSVLKTSKQSGTQSSVKQRRV